MSKGRPLRGWPEQVLGGQTDLGENSGPSVAYGIFGKAFKAVCASVFPSMKRNLNRLPYRVSVEPPQVGVARSAWM